jgi:hypothetical protein
MPRHLTDVVQVKLRIPEFLRRSIEKKAKKAGLTMNGQLVNMLLTADKEDRDALIIGIFEFTQNRILDIYGALVPREAGQLVPEGYSQLKGEELTRQLETAAKKLQKARKQTDQPSEK